MTTEISYFPNHVREFFSTDGMHVSSEKLNSLGQNILKLMDDMEAEIDRKYSFDHDILWKVCEEEIDDEMEDFFGVEPQFLIYDIIDAVCDDKYVTDIREYLKTPLCSIYNRIRSEYPDEDALTKVTHEDIKTIKDGIYDWLICYEDVCSLEV